MQVQIWTDGSAKVHTSKAGGWAYVCKFWPDGSEIPFEFWGSGGERDTTSNRMELTAIVEALKLVWNSSLMGCPVSVYSDSQYCVNGITQWIHAWRANNFKNGEVKNRDLWEELYKYTELVDPMYEWIRGHSGNVMNERVDKLAVAAAEIVK
jgi:ribonuclease HI